MILQRCTHPQPCFDDGKCHYKGECGHRAPLTNADHIRSMSGEEMAKFLAVTAGDKIGGMAKFWLEWLQQPAEEDKHETD